MSGSSCSRANVALDFQERRPRHSDEPENLTSLFNTPTGARPQLIFKSVQWGTVARPTGLVGERVIVSVPFMPFVTYSVRSYGQSTIEWTCRD